MIIGLKRGYNKITPHNPAWEAVFEEEKRLIKKLLDEKVLDIQHVGSTAIPSIPAKPIIDIAVGVSDLSLAESFQRSLESVGYTYFGEHDIAGQRLFVKGSEAARTHYVHITEFDSWKWQEYILFRDYLKTHPMIATQYANLKERLVAEYPDNRKAYTAAKADFVINIIRIARGDLRK